MRTMADLRRFAASSVDAFKRKAGMSTFAEVSSPGGGGTGGPEIKCVRVQSVVTTPNPGFMVRDIDSGGAPTGNPFFVYAYSITDLTNQIPGFTPADCLPSFVSGMGLRIIYMRVWDPASQAWYDPAWWTLGDLMHRCP